MSAGARDFVVTGGAGFIGSHLVDRLAERGRVRVLDDLSTGRERNLEAALATGRVTLHAGDVCDLGWVTRQLEGVSDDAVLFHLAARDLRRGLADPADSFRVNLDGTRAVVAAWQGRRGRLVHVSTSEVFGSSDHALGAGSATQPLTAYGRSKLEGERCVELARDQGRLAAVVVRPFNAYGPRSHAAGPSGELIPRWLVRAARGEPLPVFGDGRQTRTFTFVADTVEALLRLAEHPAAGAGTWLVAGEDELSLLDVARAVADTVDRDVRMEHLDERPGDLRRQRADARATHRLLGWTPSVRFRDGLARTWASLAADAHTLSVSDVNWG